jgi:hypothetical protein
LETSRGDAMWRIMGRQEDNIKKSINNVVRELDWIELGQNRTQWRKIMKMVMNFEFRKMKEFPEEILETYRKQVLK